MIIRNGKTTQHNIHAPAQNSTEHRREKRPSKDILKLKLECSSARIALLLQTRDGKHTPKKTHAHKIVVLFHIYEYYGGHSQYICRHVAVTCYECEAVECVCVNAIYFLALCAAEWK